MHDIIKNMKRIAVVCTCITFFLFAPTALAQFDLGEDINTDLLNELLEQLGNGGGFVPSNQAVDIPSLDELMESTEQALRITLLTKDPQPGETVQLSLFHYGRDYLNYSNITWFVNGAEYESGVGKKRISIKTGAVGSTYSVRAVAVSDIETYETSPITFSVANIDLLWEAAQSYTHPFYRGKALPAMDTAVRIVAIPQVSNQGGTVPAASLVYSWDQ